MPACCVHRCRPPAGRLWGRGAGGAAPSGTGSAGRGTARLLSRGSEPGRVGERPTQSARKPEGSVSAQGRPTPKGRDLAAGAAAHGDFLHLSSRWTLTARQVVGTGTAEGAQVLGGPAGRHP